MALPCSAQRGVYTGPATSDCPLADFDSQVHFLNGPGDYYATVIDRRNISNHACIFDRPVMGANCVSGLVRADQPESLKYECVWTDHPFILYPGQVVRQGVRWRTTPPSGSGSCIQPMFGGGPGVSVVAPTLTKKECSNREFSPFYLVTTSDSSSGAGQATDTSQTPKFDLTSDRNRYDGGEHFSVHVSLVQPASEALAQQASCPTLYLRHGSPDGAIRIDEVHPMAFEGCPLFVPGHEPVDWHSGFELYSTPSGGLIGFGEHTFQVLQLAGSLDDPQLLFATSNVLRVQIDDPSLIPRKWGTRARGVAVDITLDKDTFRVGEDVPLHLAVENFDAESPIYGRAECGIVRIEVRDADGQPLRYDERFFDISICSGHGLGLVPYARGEILPLETSLRTEGWLPNRVGTYTVAVSWSVWDHQPPGIALTDAPYAIANVTRTIRIVGESAPNSK
jgi:hypothetical protein